MSNNKKNEMIKKNENRKSLNNRNIMWINKKNVDQ